ncbi:MAG: helix-turn-helix transcriptional regulator [Acidimicrobiia bacterium]|nr:helix-turn-helix transcriptional regulator [Acidimicrobiia bacterium]
MNEAERWVEFGSFLRQQRDKVGLSRREAARRSKVPESTWRDLETGRRPPTGRACACCRTRAPRSSTRWPRSSSSRPRS